MNVISDTELKKIIDNWFKYDRNEKTIQEVKQLVAANKMGQLRAIMYPPLQFGTAGLRARMGAGFACMNEVTVIQAAQGLAAYIRKIYSPEECLKKGIIIGYDARHNSKRYAQLSANVFLFNKIRTRTFSKFVATPFVPFGVNHYKCLAGVMVTASHNPKQDNGYKVYWTNSIQIIPPIDTDIADQIAQHQCPQEYAWVDQPGTEDPFDEIHTLFFKSLARQWTFKDITSQSPIVFTYTAMHGVGAPFSTYSLETAGVRRDKIVTVKEQCDPDPNFSTVVFPNPEEGKSALDLSMSTAERHGSKIILANDPDADRLAVAEKLPNGTWKIFTGNELGALLGWWQLFLFKYKHPNESLSKCFMLASTVSSMILKTMSKKEGFGFEETLTGFKWLGSRALDLENNGKKVLFAFEESIGYMIGTRVLDKDGVTACAAFAEMAAWLHAKEGLTPAQKLRQIFKTYGFHRNYNSFLVCPDPSKTTIMYKAMQTMNKGKYPDRVAGAKVIGIRDLLNGYDSDRPDKKALLPLCPSSPVLTLRFDNNITLSIRSSGTEPKVKWYSEIIGPSDNGLDKKLRNFVDAAVCELMQPQKYGFITQRKMAKL